MCQARQREGRVEARWFIRLDAFASAGWANGTLHLSSRVPKAPGFLLIPYHVLLPSTRASA